MGHNIRVGRLWGRFWAAVLIAGIAAGCAGKAPVSKEPAAAPGAPAASIVGLWIADEIAANPVPADARVTLSLYANGKVVGRAGCNTYFGKYRRDGEAIAFTSTIATQMACAPDVMKREQLYFQTLAAVTRHQRPADGSLVLTTDAGATLRFRRDEAAALHDARGRGIAFRGVGQEPGWVVEVKEGDKITALLEYGATTLTLPTPAYAEADGVITYDTSTDTDHLVLKIRDKTCIDAMSGEAHPQTVELTVNDKPYTGCGNWLE